MYSNEHDISKNVQKSGVSNTLKCSSNEESLVNQCLSRKVSFAQGLTYELHGLKEKG